MIVECAAAIDNEYDSLSNATVHYHRHQNEYDNNKKTKNTRKRNEQTNLMVAW